MKPLKILIDDIHKWSPYYASDNIETTSNYLQNIDSKPSYIINLSEDLKYLEQGYYACLLANANNDFIIPNVTTLNDISHFETTHLTSISLKLNSTEVNKLTDADTFFFKIFFGTTSIKNLENIAKKIFEKYPVPILEIELVRENNKWAFYDLKIVNISSLNEQEQTFFAEALNNFSTKIWRKKKYKKTYQYDLAILYDLLEELPPSDSKALKNFHRAADNLGIYVDFITQHDYMKLLEYDGLFIRTTTSINHYSYKFAKKAEDNNLVVIDDTQSITCCTNKVDLNNLLIKHKIAMPESRLIFKDNTVGLDDLIAELGLPVVLKIPDGSFSKGVKKANSIEELNDILTIMFKQSSVVIAQKYYYTEFDWRIGVLNNKPIYACKYYMAKGHWQITNHAKKIQHGGTEAFAIQQVDKAVLKAALKAAKTIGSGLYGIDIKMVGNKPLIIEINDNPSIRC
jgi:glutathione synthase/RimK-type ligase-like ATP-grasp enzyme